MKIITRKIIKKWGFEGEGTNTVKWIKNNKKQDKIRNLSHTNKKGFEGEGKYSDKNEKENEGKRN